MQHTIFIGVGANLTSERNGAPIDTCRHAVKQVITISSVVFTGISPWYSSAPLPASDQPNYVNGVIRLASAIEPASLLQSLHRIEAEAGRVRGVANAARVLDLDLLAVGDLVVCGPGLRLPHPRMADRAFVLQPLSDVAPGWRHPVLKRTATELLQLLPPQSIERLPETTQDLLLRARALT